MEQTKLDRLTIEEVSGVLGEDEPGGSGPANQLPGWMVTKAVGGERFLDRIKKAMGEPKEGYVTEPEARELVLKAGDRLLVFEGMRFGTVALVRKARHDLRDKTTGKYAKTVEHEDGTITHSTPLGVVQHGGNVHPALREALRQSK